MFHSRIGLLTAAATLFCLTAQPINTHASEAESPAAQTQSQPASTAGDNKTALLEGVSFADIRQGTRTKLSDTKQWIKDQKAVESIKGGLQGLETGVDRLQDRVTPAGRSLKKSIKNNLPGKGLAHKSDKSFSVYGILLMMAFAFVFLLMSLSSPMSRLGGRH